MDNRCSLKIIDYLILSCIEKNEEIQPLSLRKNIVSLCPDIGSHILRDRLRTLKNKHHYVRETLHFKQTSQKEVSPVGYLTLTPLGKDVLKSISSLVQNKTRW